MLLGYITLFTALIISLSAAVYSILGLTAIFAAAFWPIVIMGGSLEVGKIVTTLWLHKYWNKAEIQYKLYLCSAVAILMLLTSMGVFGFLSKAHSDQSLVSGDVGAKIAIYDEKIKISRENIDANRKQLKQMDEAVDQVMGRSSDEKGADKAVAIRRGQAAERKRLLNEIEAEQKKITALNEERAPIAAENRKVEAEVGPIKYIAALIYGDNPEANVLEKSVRWVIILIVIVFDPLALTLLLAATKSIEWEHGVDLFNMEKKKRDEEEVEEKKEEEPEPIGDEPVFDKVEIPLEDPFAEEEVIEEEHPFKGKGAQPAMPLTASYEQPKVEEVKEEPVLITRIAFPESNAETYVKPKKVARADIAPYGNDLHQHAMSVWKAANPDSTFIEYIDKLEAGEITELPWEHADHTEALPLSDREKLELMAKPDNEPNAGEVRGFGSEFPKTANKGDMFLRVDSLPSVLYKFNGTQWIRVNKNLSDSYIYDDEYISHLIEKVGSGEYDPDLLSDAEKERIAETLRKQPEQG